MLTSVSPALNMKSSGSYFTDSRENETIVVKKEDTEKTKRDVNIIGPIPTRYRGQATGRTTFDGILAEDLQLPTNEVGQFQAQSAFTSRFDQSRTQVGSQTTRLGQFQAESRPDVYNVDGKEEITYDGVFASDLMVPHAHVSVVNQQARSVKPQYFRQRFVHKIQINSAF